MSSYDAAYSSAILCDRSSEGRLRVTGADRVEWLQGLLTNDVAALAPGEGCYAAYLTPQGRMVSDLRVLAFDDSLLLDLPGDRRPAVLERFEQFIITEDVQVSDVTSSLLRLSAHGPNAPAILRQALDVLAPDIAARVASLSEHAHVSDELDGATLIVAATRELGRPGFDIYCAADRLASVVGALRSAGAIDADAQTYETLRIEAGRPRFGVDMDTDTIPLEAGIENRAISQTKGCYVGQEIIIRVLHRGGGRVARRLVGLSLDDGSPSDVPAAGTVLRHGERDSGRVTSAAWSPSLGRVIALGYVARDAAEPGTAISVAASPPRTAQVTALPFVAAS
jgi:folate-binding protein YgfZ